MTKMKFIYLKTFKQLLPKRQSFIVGNRCFYVSTWQYNNNIEQNFNVYNNNKDANEKFYEDLTNNCLNYKDHNCLIIHPYIKWGPRKETMTTPQRQLTEAVALVGSLPNWRIRDQLLIPLKSLDKRLLFGSGTLDSLKKQIRTDRNVTAVFINVGTLKPIQQVELQVQFGVPVLDRYTVVMQILREHATSKAARLQVALAEIPYIRARLGHADIAAIEALDRQEQSLRAQLEEVRQHRVLLRKKRRRLGYAVIAVVGYTNAGKTSLIKALSGEEKLQPLDRLFATLDVTVHSGTLPCGLQVLYVDTVGFMANIPTTLIDCFMATLEDVFLADVVIHVQDISNEDATYQSEHVITTLKRLAENELEFPPIISVGNKQDKLLGNQPGVNCDSLVSATNGLGLNDLKQTIQEAVIKATDRKMLTIRLNAGSEETRWFYKNSQVLSATPDPENVQLQLLKVLITKQALGHFYRHFIHDPT